MSGEWKHGDVALVNGRVSLCSGSKWVHVDPTAFNYNVFDPGLEIRSLVVIDPDDVEQVERLWLLVDAWQARVPYADVREDGDLTGITAAQSALREFARPTPRIEEPGFPSIVTDGDGEHWANHANGSWTCLNSAPGVDRPRTWDTLVTDYGPISILSPGVTP